MDFFLVSHFLLLLLFSCLILDFHYWRAYWKLLEAGVGPFFVLADMAMMMVDDG